ncbi:hypothetical protein EDD16DRAFT_1727508 [Pisolithus croceorrhizus]|nr:hypothetical protein EDD16DRAFT_1727508 [Pisolithus croceorrhizus]
MKAKVCGCGWETFSSRLTHEYYEMTESHRRQRLLFSRLASWWARPEWAHPSNFPVDASMQVVVQVVTRGYSSTGSLGGSRGNRGCPAYLSTSTIAGCQGCESEREARGCAACLNMSTNMGRRDHKSRREVDHKSPMTHYALDWGPGAVPRLSDDSALPLRVVHTMVVLRGGEGALASGAETHLEELFGPVAFNYPHPPRVAGLDSKEAFDCH